MYGAVHDRSEEAMYGAVGCQADRGELVRLVMCDTMHAKRGSPCTTSVIHHARYRA
jgi:hypothetical protein